MSPLPFLTIGLVLRWVSAEHEDQSMLQVQYQSEDSVEPPVAPDWQRIALQEHLVQASRLVDHDCEYVAEKYECRIAREFLKFFLASAATADEDTSVDMDTLVERKCQTVYTDDECERAKDRLQRLKKTVEGSGDEAKEELQKELMVRELHPFQKLAKYLYSLGEQEMPREELDEFMLDMQAANGKSQHMLTALLKAGLERSLAEQAISIMDLDRNGVFSPGERSITKKALDLIVRLTPELPMSRDIYTGVEVLVLGLPHSGTRTLRDALWMLGGHRSVDIEQFGSNIVGFTKESCPDHQEWCPHYSRVEENLKVNVSAFLNKTVFDIWGHWLNVTRRGAPDEAFDQPLQTITERRLTAVTSDIPFWPAWRHLIKRFPHAKVVLAQYPFGAEGWAKNIRENIGSKSFVTNWEVNYGNDNRCFKALTQFRGLTRHEEQECEKFYKQRIADIQKEVPADQLLEFDVKQGWAPLAKFLGKPVPNWPFPGTELARSKRKAKDMKYVVKGIKGRRAAEMTTTPGY